MHPDDLRALLEALGSDLAAASADRAAAMGKVREAVANLSRQEPHATPVSIAEAARLVGLTRPTIYSLINRGDSHA